MGKSRGPRKRKDPAAGRNAAEQRDAEPQTQSKGELVPPPRRPSTALAAETPPPPREPVHHSRVEVNPAPVLVQLVEALRLVAGTMIDIADAAAEALRRRLETRA